MFILFIVACSTTENIYQVIETKSNDVKLNNDVYSYSNEDLTIFYDLWGEGGGLNIRVYNKTLTPMNLDLARCHYIKNGESMDFYTGSEKTQTETGAQTVRSSQVQISTQTEKSVKSKEKEIIEIPPLSFVRFNKYDISGNRYKDCVLREYEKNAPAFLTFNDTTSPVKFRVYLTYSFSPTFEKVKTVDNLLWISKITNMYEVDFQGKASKIYPRPECKDDDPIDGFEYPYSKQNSFYFQYEITTSLF